ncbi:MAG TPA: glycoside hydrolase family 2 TIM barrel-domain containing protein [Gemmatimonadaceae bacterium]|nr:glycoside hydrolase family 2 TIM barrel-domain containing protein [Gemmatimonadaceae bacterium]
MGGRPNLSRAARAALAGALACGLPAAALAQGSGEGSAPMRLLAFADGESVRIQLDVPNASSLGAGPVRATIRSVSGGKPLWSGTLGALDIGADGAGHLVKRVAHLHPRLWSPEAPHLYRLVVQAGSARDSVRFGFRSMVARDGRLYLNGRPIFLRGNAINPPDRNLPDSLNENRRFAEDYVRYLKRIGVNIVRLTRTSQVWLDVCDELGMMVFQGNYGTPEGGSHTAPPDRPFEQSLRWYEDEVLGPLVNHPSVTVYVLSNEQASDEIPYLSDGADSIRAFLTRSYDALRKWDDTRVYIGNAGYGFGRSGDICDIHRYWGWYYNSFLSFYTLRDPHVCWRSGHPQPVTLTENTGNYTGPDGRFNLVPRTKQPPSQLHWTGHAPDAEQPARALAYQAFVAKQAIEITRRTRDRDPYLSGLLPFTILFRNWWGISRFADMAPKPVAAQYALSYQPVLLSWESWTPQVYAGATIHPVAHVVNDATDGRALHRITLRWTLRATSGAARASGRVRLPDVAYYAAADTTLAIALPASLSTGDYVLSGVVLRGADTLSRNETPLFVARRDYAGAVNAPARRVKVFDAVGGTAQALHALGVPFERVTRFDGLDAAHDLLVIGEGAWDETLGEARAPLRAFVSAGGRVLCLAQDAGRFDPSWLPAGVRLQTTPLDHSLVYPGGRPNRDGMAVNPERPDHPVFDGLSRDRLFLWSDYTAWNESRPGFPAVYPVTSGFVLTDRSAAALGRVAILADYGHALEGVALAELFDGTGSVVLSGFDLVRRVGIDPAADRLLANLVRYETSSAPHHAAPMVGDTVTWGDYASERGAVTGIYDGMLLNTIPLVPDGLKAKYPVRVDAQGFHLAGGGGGWNSKPSIEYFAHGRRPFGPYEFSIGGTVHVPKGAAQSGEGTVWVRTPAGKTTAVTVAENPADEPLELTVVVDGEAQSARIPAHGTGEVRSALGAERADGAHGITFRGDRRLVVTRTSFQ